MKVKLSITLEKDLVKVIDKYRGKIKRSTFIEGLLIEQLGMEYEKK